MIDTIWTSLCDQPAMASMYDALYARAEQGNKF